MPSRSILLVDDNRLFIELFKCYATSSPDINLACAVSIDDALNEIAKIQPIVILLDNRLSPYNNFAETVPIIRRSGYTGKIVVISANTHDTIFDDCEAYSVSEYLDKFEFNYSNFNSVVSRVLS